MSRVAFRVANAAALARPSLGSNPKSPSSSSALLFSSPIPSVCDAPRSNRVSSVFFVARNDDAKRAFSASWREIGSSVAGPAERATSPEALEAPSTSRVSFARTGTGVSPLASAAALSAASRSSLCLRTAAVALALRDNVARCFTYDTKCSASHAFFQRAR